MSMRATALTLALASVGVLAFADTASAGIPPGYIRVDSGTLTARAGTQARGSVGCPAGTVVLGGSVFAFSTSLLANINSSFPQRNGWTAFVNNGSDADLNYDITAICATRPAHYRVVKAARVSAPSGSQTAAHATCPAGSQPFSGGALSSSSSPFVDLASSYPRGRTWRVNETNASFDPAKLTP